MDQTIVSKLWRAPLLHLPYGGLLVEAAAAAAAVQARVSESELRRERRLSRERGHRETMTLPRGLELQKCEGHQERRSPREGKDRCQRGRGSLRGKSHRGRCRSGQEDRRCSGWSCWQGSAEGVCQRALPEGMCVPPGGHVHVHVCVATLQEDSREGLTEVETLCETGDRYLSWK